MSHSTVPHLLHDYFNRIYWPKKLGGKVQTHRLYRQVIDRFGEFLERPARVDDLYEDVICAFLQSRIAEGLSAHTVDKEKDKIVALANFAARKRHVDEFPEIPAIPTPDRAPTALRLDQVDALLSACKMITGTIGDARAADWWYAYHVVSLVTGERTGAMLKLEWSWLRPDGWLPVPGAVRKCSKAATHWLPQGAMDAVAKLRDKTFSLIFAKDFCLGTFYNRNKKILAAAGLPTTREFQPQVNRRTFASWLEARGGNATEALLHSKRSTTTTSYLDPTIATKSPASIVVAEALQLA